MTESVFYSTAKRTQDGKISGSFVLSDIITRFRLTANVFNKDGKIGFNYKSAIKGEGSPLVLQPLDGEKQALPSMTRQPSLRPRPPPLAAPHRPEAPRTPLSRGRLAPRSAPPPPPERACRRC